MEEMRIFPWPEEEEVRHGMALRLRGTPLELRDWVYACRKRKRNGTGPATGTWTLPKVPIIKELVLRQEFLRGIALPSLAKLLRESFVALESFRFERCSGRMAGAEIHFYNGKITLYLTREAKRYG